MIVKTLDCGPAVNVVLGLITEHDQDAEAYFAAKGLPDAAQDTCLAPLLARPIRTSLQYFARILAYCELLKQGNKVLNTAHISLSHTPGAVAIAWGSPEKFEGVGVDIEHKKRCIGPELERYFIVPEDSQTGLDRLYQSGATQGSVAKELGITGTQLKTWWLEIEAFGSA